MRKFLLLAALVMASSAIAEDQGEQPAVTPAHQANRLPPIFVSPPDPHYPAELIDGGVQGTTELRLRLNSAGMPTEVAVYASSRSQALDEAALAFGWDLKFTAKDPEKPLSELIVPIEFSRDSITTLPKKSCAEFNVDVAYFKTTFPELDTRKMTVINLIVGGFGLAGLSSTPEKSLEHVRNVEAAAKGIVDACAEKPQAGFMKTFRALVKKGHS